MRVRLWVGVGQDGHGFIGLTRQDVIDGLAGASTIAIAELSCWELSRAMAKGSILPVRFLLNSGRAGTDVRKALREVRSWSDA